MKNDKNENKRDRSQLVVALGESAAGRKAKRALVRAAKRAGKKPSTWAREVLLAKAQQVALPTVSFAEAVAKAETNRRRPVERLSTGFAEVDRALGGGLVRGSSLLLVGPMGMGKSTLLHQIAATLAMYGEVLYVATEESTKDARAVADRLGLTSERVHVLGYGSAELNDVEVQSICDKARALRVVAVVVNSIQATRSEIAGGRGDIAQVRAVSRHLASFASREGVTVLAIGHLTKDENIAGGKAVEHAFDAVAYLDCDLDYGPEIGRCSFSIPDKNRFGKVPAVAHLTMTEHGLVDAPHDG